VNLLTTTDERFDRTPDGAIWTKSQMAHRFWQRYLEIFAHVRVAARIREVASPAAETVRADGEGVSFAPLPSHSGAAHYLAKFSLVARAAREAVDQAEAVILRVPQANNRIYTLLSQARHPYALHVGGDPHDAFAPGAVNHPLRPLLRIWFARLLRRQCAGACAASYVTRAALQRRYPCFGFTTHFSDVDIPETTLLPAPRVFRPENKQLKIITVGTLAQLYKGPDVLIKAFAQSVHAGADLILELVGDGKERPGLEQLADSLGVRRRIHFAGHTPPGVAIRNRLDQADLFVLPSRQEGLPRAMIEAMGRGLPCIGSTVGGIPELLPPDALVEPGDAPGLATKLLEVVRDPQRMTEMSAHSLNKAREYSADRMRARRLEFYRFVSDCTEDWLRRNRPSR
jgi:glycosyltransferase involved in cell wall biosynthesis